MPIVAKARRAVVAEPVHRSDVVARQRVRQVAPPPGAVVEPATLPVAPTSSPVDLAANDRDTPAPAERTYDVGYAKPPRHSRFKKGRSGNPRGRPKGVKSMKTLARQLLTEQVMVKTAAGPRRMTRMQAALHKIAERAFGGDLRALQSLVQLYQMAVPDEPIRVEAASVAAVDLDDNDQAVLAALSSLLMEEKGREQ